MMQSRRFTVVDVPEPTNLITNFVYNFFVANERVDETGSPHARGVKNKDLQKLVDYSSLQFEVPRYVEVSFSQVETFGDSYGDAKNQVQQNQLDISKANSEETITNVGFISLRESDDAIPRIKEKLDALSRILGIGFEDSDQSKKISSLMGVNQDDVQSIISPLNSDKYLVNARKNAIPVNVFQLAAESKITSQINKRLAAACINSADDVSPLSKTDIVANADGITKEFVSKAAQNILLDEDIEPLIEPTSLSETQEGKKLLGVSASGYLLTRYRIGEGGKKSQTKVFFLPGAENTKYLDSEVVYGATYSYSVRSVYQVDAIVNGVIQPELDTQVSDVEGKRNWRISFLVASRPSATSRTRAEEFEPPNEPDGVFYNFNYDNEAGLIIRWQIPSGRSRDVKYFQVFRRKNIFEPFVCIGQIDFDDSVVRTLLPEQVRDDRIYAYPGIRTFFEDANFSRTDKYMYAVTAVDAHGLSSGYSAQTEVSFNRSKNSLVLKSISRAGAPKQYPNFYVDPDLDDNIAVDSFTQDAIFDSGHKKMTIYFTPDARFAVTANGDTEGVFYTNNQQGSYSLHLINLDSQKSDTATINVKDLRKKQ